MILNDEMEFVSKEWLWLFLNTTSEFTSSDWDRPCKFRKGGRSPCRDWNRRPPDYETGVLFQCCPYDKFFGTFET